MDLIQTGPTIKSTTGDTLLLMQAALNVWNSSLSATGGALVPEKSFWYLIDFKWSSSCWSYMPKQTTMEPLLMNNHLGNCLPLLRLHTSEARWTLGVYLAPDGNNKLQESILLEKTKTWAQNTIAAHLDQMAVWLNITMTLIQQVYYILPVTILTPKQCEWIMQPCLMDGMVVAGYNRSFPRVIISAPSKYYGLNLTDMYTEQGIQHLLAMLQYGHSSNNLMGRLIWGSLETMTLELGSLNNLFTWCTA